MPSAKSRSLIFGGGAAGQRGGGNKQARVGERGAQPPQKLDASGDFAHGNCVQPDRAWTGLSKGARQKAEALRQGAPIAAVPQAAVEEIQ